MASRDGIPTVEQREMPKIASQNAEVKKEIMDPSYCPKSQDYPNSQYPSSQDCPSFQNYLNYFPNSQNFQNYQNYQNIQFSPNLNQNPISEQVQPSQNISCNLFGGVEQTNTNQNGPKMVWRVKEDVALMSAWCSVDEDKVKGKIQKGGSLWRRVHALFHKAQVENPEEIYDRNVDSLKGRFKRITTNANKWLAAYQKAYSQKRSGMSLKDVENEAHTIYEACGSKFQDLVVFNEVMSKHSNWELRFDHDATCFHSENEEGNEESSENEEGNEESGGSSKRARTTEEGEYSILSNPETTPSTDDSTMSRPTSRDKAKQKGKGKSSQSSTTNKVAAEIRALRLTRDNEAELMRARLDLEREKLQRNSMKMKEKMLNTLLAKDHLSEEDKDMKRRLMAIVFGP